MDDAASLKAQSHHLRCKAGARAQNKRQRGSLQP